MVVLFVHHLFSFIKLVFSISITFKHCIVSLLMCIYSTLCTRAVYKNYRTCWPVYNNIMVMFNEHMNHIIIIIVHVVLIVITAWVFELITATESGDIFAIGYNNIAIVYLKLTSRVNMQYHSIFIPDR